VLLPDRVSQIRMLGRIGISGPGSTNWKVDTSDGVLETTPVVTVIGTCAAASTGVTTVSVVPPAWTTGVAGTPPKLTVVAP